MLPVQWARRALWSCFFVLGCLPTGTWRATTHRFILRVNLAISRSAVCSSDAAQAWRREMHKGALCCTSRRGLGTRRWSRPCWIAPPIRTWWITTGVQVNRCLWDMGGRKKREWVYNELWLPRDAELEHSDRLRERERERERESERSYR